MSVAPAWAQLSIASIQASPAGGSPLNVSGVTSTAPATAINLYITVNNLPVGAIPAVTWFNTVTQATYTDTEPGVNGNVVTAVIPYYMYASSVASTQPVQIRVTVGESQATGSFNVYPVPGPIGNSLPLGTTGVSYSATLITGGTPPYSPISTTGSVPGLTYSAQIDAISGTPTQAGQFPISVLLVDVWGVQGTASYTLQVVAPATVTSVVPNAAPAGSGLMTITVNGSNFLDPESPAGASQVQWTYLTSTSLLSTTYVSATQLEAIVPTALMSQAGTATISVLQPNDIAYGALPFTLNAPSLNNLSPQSVVQNSAAFTLTINGANFATRVGAPDVVAAPFQPQVQFGTTTLQGTWVSASQVTVTVPANLITTAATIPVSVINPGGSTSGSLNFLVNSNLTITSTTLNQGTVGSSYSFPLTATGGTTPYTWSVQGLPTGLSVNAQTGVISGTPQSNGSFPLTVQVKDAAQTQVSITPTLVILPPPLNITTTTPTSGVVGVAYLFHMAATGGVTPYQWSATGLPTGLSINQQTGDISGTPQAAGSYPLTIRVTDSQQTQAAVTPTLVIAPPALTITTTFLTGGVLNVPYLFHMTASGGAPAYTWSARGLPNGLGINQQTGDISGTPLAAGSFQVTVGVFDQQESQTSTSYVLVIAASPLTITTASLGGGTVGVSYLFHMNASGGTAAYQWSATGLPTGLSINPQTGDISGTPQTAGSYPVTVRVTDSQQLQASANYTLVIAPALSITTTALPSGTAGTAYSFQVIASGGATPYQWSATGLPTGLTINAQSGLISGTTQANGSFPLVIRVTDAQQSQATANLTLTIGIAALTITTTSLPSGTVGTAYLFRVAASGGTPPYRWSATGLPTGFSMNAQTGDISGTPQTNGAFPLVIRVTDSAQTPAQTTANLTLVIAPAPLTITTTALGQGTQGSPYLFHLAASGGIQPYQWSATGLPNGLTINQQTGDISGTPQTAGSFPIGITVADSIQGRAVATLTLTINVASLVITTGSLATGGNLIPYFSHMTATGGVPPYQWSATGLPPGLTINANTGDITGTSQTGNYTPTIRVSDSAQASVNRSYSLIIAPPLPIITTPSVLPDGLVGVAYAANLDATGNGYTYSVGGGSLPNGLTLTAAGGITGIPTKAGTFSFTAVATDTLGNVLTKVFTITIVASPLQTTNPSATLTVGLPARIVLGASGGVTPYRFSLSCALPDGLTYAGNVISGTPTTPGTSNCSYTVNDSAGNSATQAFTITVNPGPITFAGGPLPGGQVGVNYSRQVVATGGTAPFIYSATGLPDGLSISSAGLISGVPTTFGSFTITVVATDATRSSATATFTLTIIPAALTVTSGALPDGTVGVPYLATLRATGGVSPYTWTVNGLPSGLSVSILGVVSGTPDTAGTSTATVSVKDSAGTVATAAVSVKIVPPPLSITTATAPAGTVGTAYSVTFAATGGAPPLTWTATGLPSGLTISSSGVVSGTPTAPGSSDTIVTTRDSAGTSVSKTFTIVVSLPATPPFTIGGVGNTANPAQQVQVTVSLATPYPVDITVILTLTFKADNGGDDPSIQFSTGGRTVQITIPAGSTSGSTSVGVQTGTVAGVITLSAQLKAGDVDITSSPAPQQTIRIAPGPPVLTQVTATRTSTGFTVTITGYTVTREAVQAAFQFNPAAGTNLQTTNLTIPLDSLFAAYFSSTTAAPFGGQFTLVQPFTITGNLQGIASVSVNVSNKVGTSQTLTATLQ